MITTILWPPPSMVTSIEPAIESAFKSHSLFTEKLLAIAAVPPGPYALFHHNSHVFERMNDVKTIVTRIIDNRQLLTKIVQREEMLRPKKQQYKQTLSKRLQEVVNKRSQVHQSLKLDMESLFVFGNLLLDQWAYVIGYVTGRKEPEKFNFVQMSYQLQKKGDKGLLEPLWNNHCEDLLWLFYQIRNYRNIFIEHVTSPWQRGTSMETTGDNFRLGSPSPVDWISQEDIEQTVNNIRYLAPEWARSPHMEWYTKHPRQLLEIIFFYIDKIKEQSEREEVWNVWKKLGGWTFSYDMIAFRLMRFMDESVTTMIDIVMSHPEAIIVGAAPTGITTS